MPRLLLLLALTATASPAQDGARYLVIAADSLASAVQPLADWYHATGLSSRVVRLSAAGRDTLSIRNYIINAYNTWTPRPEYVLLVGCGDSLPARLYSSGGSVYASSDNVYANTAGSLLAELAVGRLPAKSALQVEEMVKKTLAYARTPDTLDRFWTRKLTTIVRDAGDDDGPLYRADAGYGAERAAAAGFVGCDSFASSRGDTVTDIYASVDSGVGLVLYRGAATGNWYAPFKVNPARLVNGTRCPVVVSATCATMTLAPSESMVGDAWIKTGTVSTVRGAVAFFGNTHSDVGVAAVRSSLARAFFDSLLVGRTWRLGHACRKARAAMYAQYPAYTADYLGFNLLGDPALDVWTGLPRAISVTHPPRLGTGSQTVSVEVHDALAPVESALVCLSMAGDWLYATGYTDPLGRLALDVNLRTIGPLRIVVTGHNLYPYDSVIPVELTGIDDAGRLPAPARSLVASPSTFTGPVSLGWSAPLEADARLRVFDALGRTVAELPAGTGSTSVRWHATATPAGVYRCLLVDRDGSLLGSTTAVKMQ